MAIKDKSTLEHELVDGEGNHIYENDETITAQKNQSHHEEPAAVEEYEQVNPYPPSVEFDNLE